jgi:hypothetical protein
LDDFLRERSLELSPEKTIVTHIIEGFDFLGQNVRKYDGKLLIRPSKKSGKCGKPGLLQPRLHLFDLRGSLRSLIFWCLGCAGMLWVAVTCFFFASVR